MVQTTDLGAFHDVAATGRFHGPGIRRVLPESKVRPGSVVVADIASEDPSQMVLVEDHHVVQAFPPDGTNDAFDIRILPRGTWCNENGLGGFG
jgi:hypothetical protein